MFFEVSRPVTKAEFFDRERELQELLRTVEMLQRGSTRYLALLGLRKMGKTSLLRQFMAMVEAPQVVPFLLDCWEKRPTPQAFFQDYLVQTVDSFLQGRNSTPRVRSLRASLLQEDWLLAALADLRGLGIAALTLASDLLLALRHRNFSDTLLSGILDLPEQLAQETDHYFVVILDEFQELQDLNNFKVIREYAGDVFALLRARWQQHRRVNYIVAGSRLTMMREILTRERAPFFQHFKIVEVGPFQKTEARHLLQELSQATARPIPDELINRILELVGTNPFYLQVLGEELCARPDLDEATFKIVMQENLFSATGTLSLYFQDLVGRAVGRSASLEQTLIRLAQQPGTLSQVAANLGVPTGGLKSWIDRVADLVVVVDGVYQIADPALRLWLIRKSEAGLALPPLVLGDEAEKAVARRMAAAGFELVYQSRASRGAFDLLAISQTQEVGVQVKKAEWPFYLSRDELGRMRYWAEQLDWAPLLALVSESGVFFYDVRTLAATDGSCRIDEETPRVEYLLEI